VGADLGIRETSACRRPWVHDFVQRRPLSPALIRNALLLHEFGGWFRGGVVDGEITCRLGLVAVRIDVHAARRSRRLLCGGLELTRIVRRGPRALI
jgi:hypothetical protein